MGRYVDEGSRSDQRFILFRRPPANDNAAAATADAFGANREGHGGGHGLGPSWPLPGGHRARANATAGADYG